MSGDEAQHENGFLVCWTKKVGRRGASNRVLTITGDPDRGEVVIVV